MGLIILDITASMLQAIVIVYTIICCTDTKGKINKINIFVVTMIFFLGGQIFTKTFGNSGGIAIFAAHVLGLILTIALYKKNLLKAIMAYTIVYSIILILNIIFAGLIFEFVKTMIPQEYTIYEIIFIIYIPESLLLLLCFKYMDTIKQIHKFIINEGFSMIFIIISFILDFILTFYILTLGEKSQLVKNFVYIMFFIFCTMILIYFGKTYKKSQQILELNKALEVKNSELRKIKHDYGAQISYLYGLCLMERFDDLKKSLKDIINNNEATPTAVEISKNENSLLSLALKQAIDMGIHVIVEENCDLSLISMSEMEFYRIISNIVNNAIKAMNGEGIIIAKSYDYLGNMVISIENNGPKIPQHYLQDIFKVGFTTKENNDKSHGYGLSIVKDLVESYSGKIYVKSTDTATEFKIVFPIKKVI